jgi:hypothetical protein
MWDISPQGKQRGSLMIHRSGNPLMAEIGRLKKENDVNLVCFKRENELKGLLNGGRAALSNKPTEFMGILRLIKQAVEGDALDQSRESLLGKRRCRDIHAPVS